MVAQERGRGGQGAGIEVTGYGSALREGDRAVMGLVSKLQVVRWCEGVTC